jgi:hypothetical protein
MNLPRPHEVGERAGVRGPFHKVNLNCDGECFHMLNLDDSRWTELKGGYRIKYDPRPTLHKLSEGQCSAAWEELWQELHHQGDVGEASYAAVPHLMRIARQVCPDDWNLYSIISVIEQCRRREGNPTIPDWLEVDYAAAWNEIGEMAIARIGDAEDETLIQALFETIAIFKKQYALARFAALDESERKSALDELGWG